MVLAAGPQIGHGEAMILFLVGNVLVTAFLVILTVPARPAVTFANVNGMSIGPRSARHSSPAAASARRSEPPGRTARA